MLGVLFAWSRSYCPPAKLGTREIICFDGLYSYDIYNAA